MWLSCEVCTLRKRTWQRMLDHVRRDHGNAAIMSNINATVYNQQYQYDENYQYLCLRAQELFSHHVQYLCSSIQPTVPT